MDDPNGPDLHPGTVAVYRVTPDDAVRSPRGQSVAVLRRAVELRVNHIDTVAVGAQRLTEQDLALLGSLA
jgi:hypothetical protein